MSFASASVRTVAVTVLALAAVGCQARERRAIATQPAPGTSTTNPPQLPGTQPGNNPNGGVVPGGDPNGSVTPQPEQPGQPGTQPGQPEQPGVTPSGGDPTPPGTDPNNPGVVPPAADTGLTITTTLEDGTTVTLEWDGKTFKGNDKWDVQGQ